MAVTMNNETLNFEGSADRSVLWSVGLSFLAGMLLAAALFWVQYGFGGSAESPISEANAATEQMIATDDGDSAEAQPTVVPTKPSSVDTSAKIQATSVAPIAVATSEPEESEAAADTVSMDEPDDSAGSPEGQSSASESVETFGLAVLAEPTASSAEQDDPLVYTEADLVERVDALAADYAVELGAERGVRLRNNKVTIFVDQLSETGDSQSEIVFIPSAENGQVRVTLERATTDGYPISEPLQALILQGISAEIEQEVGARQLASIDVVEGKLLIFVR